VKSERQLIEECIEEKTKEHHRAVAELESLSSDGPSSSFANARTIMAQLQAQQNVDKAQRELQNLQIKHSQIVGDIAEQVVIQDSKEAVLKCLSDLSDGIYKLIKVKERDTHGKE
jgi:EAL domain-containing protein (putative c-di-GMP-specific phosphodiesterase class I)